MISQHNLTLRDVISCRDDIMLYLINKGVDSLVSFNIMESVRKGKSITVEQQQILENHNVPIW
ncbi:DNA polymerase III polC-type, partial [Mesomycoplasma hyorhinis]